MSSHILKLRAYVNNPERLDFSQDIVELDQSELPTLLVLDETLAHDLLRSPLCATYNLMDYWKVVTRSDQQPALDRLFRETPFFLHGEEHREINRQMTKPYRRVESQLLEWLPSLTAEYLESIEAAGTVSAYSAIAEYIRQVFVTLLAREFAVKPELVPSFDPSCGLFVMFQSAENFAQLEAVVSELYALGSKQFAEQGRDESELSALLSIAMMGREPLFAVILYGLMQSSADSSWGPQALLRDSAPVSILGRQMLADSVIGGRLFKRGQIINIATFLVRPKTAEGCPMTGHRPNAKRSLEFGAGPHLCNGRAISIAIIDVFFREWAKRPLTNLDFSKTRLFRDFVTVPKERR